MFEDLVVSRIRKLSSTFISWEDMKIYLFIITKSKYGKRKIAILKPYVQIDVIKLCIGSKKILCCSLTIVSGKGRLRE